MTGASTAYLFRLASIFVDPTHAASHRLKQQINTTADLGRGADGMPVLAVAGLDRRLSSRRHFGFDDGLLSRFYIVYWEAMHVNDRHVRPFPVLFTDR